MDLEPKDDVVVGELVLPASPWDRMPDEPESAYAHFLTYRDCGPERTVARAADAAHKSRDHFHRLATAWQWIPRANAWDAEQHRLFQVRTMAARRDMVDRHGKLGRLILGIVQARMLTIPMDELSVPELARLGDLGLKLERSAYAEEAAMSARGASTPDGVDLSKLDEAARLARLEELRNELDRRINSRRAQPLQLGAAPDAD